jgi:hypothetical protein
MRRAEAGWPTVPYVVRRRSQARAADLISGAGHSLGLHQTPREARCSRGFLRGEQWYPQVPRPRNSSVPSSRSSQGQRVVSADTPRECQTRRRGSQGTLDDDSPSRGARETVQSTARAPGLGSRCSLPSLCCIYTEGTSCRLYPVAASEAAGSVSPLSGDAETKRWRSNGCSRVSR